MLIPQPRASVQFTKNNLEKQKNSNNIFKGIFLFF
jgi:hypothetical protein